MAVLFSVKQLGNGTGTGAIYTTEFNEEIEEILGLDAEAFQLTSTAEYNRERSLATDTKQSVSVNKIDLSLNLKEGINANVSRTKGMVIKSKHSKINIESKKQKNKCSECGKCFSKRCNLVTHTRIHTGEKPLICKICEKQFAHQATLDQHILTHTGIKKFECGYCDKKFIKYSNLKTHVRTHTGEKPFDCETCSKAFSTQTQLRRHTRVHNFEQPYCCKYCQKKFSNSSNLRRHEKRVHNK